MGDCCLVKWRIIIIIIIIIIIFNEDTNVTKWFTEGSSEEN